MLRYVSPILLLSTSLFAEGPKMGGLFRGELVYNNNKTTEAPGVASGSNATMGQQAYASFTVAGPISNKVKLDSEVQFIGTGGGLASHCMLSPIRQALVTWWHSDAFSVAFGCAKQRSGGWDFSNFNEAQSIRPFNPANAANNGAGMQSFSYAPGIRAFNPSIELGLHMLGDLTLQLFNDVNTGTSPAATWTTKQQQTWNLEWRGEMFGIRPIVQYGQYDSGHSSHFDLGLNLDVAGFMFTVDYMMVSNSRKGAPGTKADVSTSNRLSVEVSYDVKGMMTPMIYFSNYTAKIKPTDIAGNSAPGVWDHQGQVIGVSVAATGLSANFSPYLAVDTQSARFFTVAGGTTKKTQSDMIVRLGTTARF